MIRLRDYYITAEVRLIVRDAESAEDARLTALTVIGQAQVVADDVEIKRIDVMACTETNTKEHP